MVYFVCFYSGIGHAGFIGEGLEPLVVSLENRKGSAADESTAGGRAAIVGGVRRDEIIAHRGEDSRPAGRGGGVNVNGRIVAVSVFGELNRLALLGECGR